MGRRSEWREEALGADPGVGAEEEGHRDGLDAADGVDEGEEEDILELDRHGGNGHGLGREVHRRYRSDRAALVTHVDANALDGLTDGARSFLRVRGFELRPGEDDASLASDGRRVLALAEQGLGEGEPVVAVKRVDSAQEDLPSLADIDEDDRGLLLGDLHAAHSGVEVDGLVGLAVGADEGGRERVRGPGEGERRAARKGEGTVRRLHFGGPLS